MKTWTEVPETKAMLVGHEYAFTYTIPLPYSQQVRSSLEAAIFAADALRDDYRVLRVIHTRPNPSLANGKKPVPWTVRVEILKTDGPSDVSLMKVAGAIKDKVKAIAGSATNTLTEPFREAKTVVKDVVEELRLVAFFAAAVLVVYVVGQRH